MILVRAIAPADGWDDAALAAAQPATPKRYRVDTRATLRRQIAFDRTPYYIVASCFAEQSNIQGAVAQLVERFVRIEEVAVSTTVSSTKPAAFIPPQRAFSFVFRRFRYFLRFPYALSSALRTVHTPVRTHAPRRPHRPRKRNPAESPYMPTSKKPFNGVIFAIFTILTPLKSHFSQNPYDSPRQTVHTNPKIR